MYSILTAVNESSQGLILNQAVSLVSDFCFACFGGFLCLSQVSSHENVSKHCLDFEMNAYFKCWYIFHGGKNYAHIWQSLDCMATYMLHHC